MGGDNFRETFYSARHKVFRSSDTSLLRRLPVSASGCSMYWQRIISALILPVLRGGQTFIVLTLLFLIWQCNLSRSITAVEHWVMAMGLCIDRTLFSGDKATGLNGAFTGAYRKGNQLTNMDLITSSKRLMRCNGHGEKKEARTGVLASLL